MWLGYSGERARHRGPRPAYHLNAVHGAGRDVYLRRRLEPADFGLYAVVQFALAIFLQFGDVGLASALVRQKAQPTRRELSSAWSFQMLVTGSITLVLWLGAPLMLAFGPTCRPTAFGSCGRCR
jgi:hypothetical protein